MSLYTYVDTPNANLVCCICRAPFTDPATTPCEHTFCRECILRALTHAPLCPVDRLPLSEGELAPSGPIIRSVGLAYISPLTWPSSPSSSNVLPLGYELVEELKVECVYRISGCSHVCQRQLLPAHLRDDCAYSQLECEEAGCGAVVTRARLKAHRIEAHGYDEEEEASQIENVEGGEGTDSDDNHAQPTSKLKSIPSSADDQQKTIELLMEQNLLLRHRVDTLDSAMQVMRREMGVVRSALGPWFRMPTQSQSHLQRPHAPQRTEQGISPAVAVLDIGVVGSHDSVHESNGMPSLSSSVASNASATNSHQPGASRLSQQTQGRGQLGLGHRASLSLSGDSGTSGGGRADSLGEYFPVLSSGFGMYPGSGGPGGPLPLPMSYGPHGGFMQHHVSGIGGTGLQMNPQTVTRVAPLDLGTNLVGTLEGLRESVVGVAAGIDSLERRSEIALANETLRLGEEVISLRAAVHGLRMQIHAMMMERNGQILGGGEGPGGGSLWMGGGGMGFGIGTQGTNANPPVVQPRVYPYAGPPSITKL